MIKLGNDVSVVTLDRGLHVTNLDSVFYVTIISTLREESSQINVILQYKLLAAILSAVCSVIQQS